MPNPTNRKVEGGPATQVYLCGSDDGALPAIAVTGDGLTDAELRETAVPVNILSQLGRAANNEDAAAAAAIVTKPAAGVGVANVIALVAWSLSAAPGAPVNLLIEDGAAGPVLFNLDVIAGGPDSIQWNPPLRGSPNTAMVISLSNPGGVIVGKVNTHSWTE